MYKNRNNLIFGFHGCDRSLCDSLVNNKTRKLNYSENEYDSVRGVFFEGNELYPSAGFREKDHIQIAIINPNCIKAFFKERISDSKFRSV